MDRILIRGGRPLAGRLAIGGAKNAALPLMAAGLLTEERLVLENIPELADIDTMASLLLEAGLTLERQGRRCAIGGRITRTEAP